MYFCNSNEGAPGAGAGGKKGVTCEGREMILAHYVKALRREIDRKEILNAAVRALSEVCGASGMALLSWEQAGTVCVEAAGTCAELAGCSTGVTLREGACRLLAGEQKGPAAHLCDRCALLPNTVKSGGHFCLPLKDPGGKCVLLVCCETPLRPEQSRYSFLVAELAALSLERTAPKVEAAVPGMPLRVAVKDAATGATLLKVWPWEQDLAAGLDAACAIVVREFGLRLAWIGLVEPRLRQSVPVACNEPSVRYLAKKWLAECEASLAEATGPLIFPDIGADDRCVNWHRLAELFNVKSFAVFPVTAGAKTVGVLGVGADRPDGLQTKRQLLEAVARQLALILDRYLAGQEVEDAFLYVIETLARAAEANEEDAARHIMRVGEYSYELARELGLPAREARAIRYAARVHDVGKLHVPPEILHKAGPLTPAERSEMQRHTLYGARILGDAPRLALARQIALYHHECWDGSGYPYGLRGEKIPLPARIVHIADIYDALRSHRVYKAPMDHATACRIILTGDEKTKPTHFDPEILRAFRRVEGRFAEIFGDSED